MTEERRKKVHMVSLGCPKNRVDSEVMVGLIQGDGEFDMVADADGADIVVVNTCGFIDDAKEESVDTILEMVERKKVGLLDKVVVTGCLSQRYSGDLEVEIPEVDAILGTKTFTAINEALKGELAEKTYIQPGSFIMDHEVARTNTVRGGTAYLKIAEGCSRSCSYCIIPKIRGTQESRTIDDVVAEAKRLGDSGVKEIILVAQDMTSYGIDLDPRENRDYLVRLLRRLDEEATQIDWVRMLYMYPWNFSDELLEILQEDNRILPYVDMPLQHINQRILKSMKRNIQRERQMDLIARLRAVDDLVLRTTFIVGYPGETDEEFQELYDWVEEVEFDRVGVFTYSPEEGTTAAEMDGQLPEEVKEERRDALMSLQREISLRKNEEWVGYNTDVIVDGVSEAHEAVLEGRHYGQAPDIDGVVYLSFDYGGDMPTPGDIVEVEIQQATDYDLAGVVIPQERNDGPIRIGGTDARLVTAES
ncbi:MAG: 30S ribosomal protein S12 methylthiotransferase RimO [Persicimonas sp.]